MLICCVCGKVIANRDPDHVRYGGCSACPIEEVREEMARIREAEKKDKE